MAELVRKPGGGMIVWGPNDWESGFMPQGGQGSGQILPGNGIRYASLFDPYRLPGFASPGFQPTNATNMAQVTGAVVATALKTSTALYGVSLDGKVQEFNPVTNTITNSGGFPRTIDHAHANEVGFDTIIYRHKITNLTTSLFYSFYDDTDWDIGCYESFTTFDDDFMSTDPTTPLGTTAADLTDGLKTPHPLEIGADDVLYAGSGRYLHGYDGSGAGTNGNFNARLLTLPAGFIIMDLLKTEPYLLIAGVFSSAVQSIPSIDSCQEALVYTWNYRDQDITDIIPLDDQFVSVIGNWRNRPFVITGGEKGNRGRNRVKIITGSNAETVAEYDGSQPSTGGVDSSSNQMLINSAGVIVGIGTPYDPNSYQVNNLMGCTVTTASGFIRNLFSGGQKIFASAGADFVQLNTGFATDARLETGFLEPIFSAGKIGRVTKVTTVFKGTFTAAASRAFTLQMFTDYDNNSFNVISGITAITADNLSQKYEYDPSGNPFPKFKNIGAVMVWTSGAGSTNAAQVSQVILEYKEVSFVNT